MNQTPEQLVRDEIDGMLQASGWVLQSKNRINLTAGVGVALREYQTAVGPADYFEKNIVSEYGYKKAVEDGVLVPYNVFEVEIKINKQGLKIFIEEYIDTCEKLIRKKFWNQLDEDVEYNTKKNF